MITYAMRRGNRYLMEVQVTESVTPTEMRRTECTTWTDDVLHAQPFTTERTSFNELQDMARDIGATLQEIPAKPPVRRRGRR